MRERIKYRADGEWQMIKRGLPNCVTGEHAEQVEEQCGVHCSSTNGVACICTNKVTEDKVFCSKHNEFVNAIFKKYKEKDVEYKEKDEKDYNSIAKERYIVTRMFAEAHRHKGIIDDESDGHWQRIHVNLNKTGSSLVQMVIDDYHGIVGIGDNEKEQGIRTVLNCLRSNGEGVGFMLSHKTGKSDITGDFVPGIKLNYEVTQNIDVCCIFYRTKNVLTFFSAPVIDTDVVDEKMNTIHIPNTIQPLNGIEQIVLMFKGNFPIGRKVVFPFFRNQNGLFDIIIKRLNTPILKSVFSAKRIPYISRSMNISFFEILECMDQLKKKQQFVETLVWALNKRKTLNKQEEKSILSEFKIQFSSEGDAFECHVSPVESVSGFSIFANDILAHPSIKNRTDLHLPLLQKLFDKLTHTKSWTIVVEKKKAVERFEEIINSPAAPMM